MKKNISRTNYYIMAIIMFAIYPWRRKAAGGGGGRREDQSQQNPRKYTILLGYTQLPAGRQTERVVVVRQESLGAGWLLLLLLSSSKWYD